MNSFSDLKWKMEKYDYEDKLLEIIHSKGQKEQRLKRNEQHIRDLWNSFMHFNIHVMSVSDKGERENRREKK